MTAVKSERATGPGALVSGVIAGDQWERTRRRCFSGLRKPQAWATRSRGKTALRAALMRVGVTSSLFSRPYGGLPVKKLIVVAVVLSLVLAPQIVAVPALAGSCVSGFAWMRQYTSLTSAYYADPAACTPQNPYYGWLGVDGEVDAPPSVTPLSSPEGQHDLGHVAMVFDELGPLGNTQMQVGFYTGTIALDPTNCTVGTCVRRSGSYGLYLESYDAPTDAYSVFSYGGYGLSQPVVFRIQYDAVSGCYKVYSFYSNLFSTDCRPPVSGMSYMARETAGFYGGSLPTANFGNSNASTNNALHVHNARTWEVWDTGLIAHGTARSDLRNTPPPYYVSPYVNYYHIKTFGG